MDAAVEVFGENTISIVLEPFLIGSRRLSRDSSNTPILAHCNQPYSSAPKTGASRSHGYLEEIRQDLSRNGFSNEEAP